LFVMPIISVYTHFYRRDAKKILTKTLKDCLFTLS